MSPENTVILHTSCRASVGGLYVNTHGLGAMRPTRSRRKVWFCIVPGYCWWLLYLRAIGKKG